MNPVLNLKGIFGSRPVLISMALCLLLQLAFTYLPIMHRLFGTAPIDLIDWALLAWRLDHRVEKAVARRWKQIMKISKAPCRFRDQSRL